MAKILIVEDYPILLNLLKETVLLQGHEALPASNGVEAIEILHNETVDLVITDIFMEGKDGLEVIEYITSLPERPKILAMTGMDPQEGADYLAIAKKYGAEGTIRKPFKVNDLNIEISKLLPTP